MLRCTEVEETRQDAPGAGIGQRLRAAREAKSKSIDEASHEAGLPVRYLRMLEEGRFPAVADPAYLTHFLRRYASYLALDVDQVTREFLLQTEPDTSARRTGKKPPEMVRPKVRLRSASPRVRLPASVPALVAAVALAGGAIAFAVVRARSAWPPSASESPVEEIARAVPTAERLVADASTAGPAETSQGVERVPAAEPVPDPTRAPDLVAMEVPRADEPAAPRSPAMEEAARSAAEPVISLGAASPPDLPTPGSPTPTESAERVSPESREVRFFPPYELEITATSNQVWLWISVDDGPRRPVSLRQGETARWVAQRAYKLSVDDAGGVRVSLNGEELPRLGDPGRARRNLLIPSRDTVPSEMPPAPQRAAG